MRKLTKRELGSVRTLANMLNDSGLSYEATVYIIGMRLSYLKAFSIANLEQVFQVKAQKHTSREKHNRISVDIFPRLVHGRFDATRGVDHDL